MFVELAHCRQVVRDVFHLSCLQYVEQSGTLSGRSRIRETHGFEQLACDASVASERGSGCCGALQGTVESWEKSIGVSRKL